MICVGPNESRSFLCLCFLICLIQSKRLGRYLGNNSTGTMIQYDRMVHGKVMHILRSMFGAQGPLGARDVGQGKLPSHLYKTVNSSLHSENMKLCIMVSMMSTFIAVPDEAVEFHKGLYVPIDAVHFLKRQLIFVCRISIVDSDQYIPSSRHIPFLLS